MPDTYQHNDNGHILSLGAHPRRQYDPKEEKYRLTRVIDVSQVDLSQPYSLVYAGDGAAVWDPRPATTDQNGLGACAAFAACEIAEICSWQAGRDAPPTLSATELYFRDRQKENGTAWADDTGSTLADNLDFAMTGLYSEADVPESFALDHSFLTDITGKPTYDFVRAHLPFYPGESSDPDYFVKAIAAAIGQRMPVDLGTDWYQPWFNPDANGVLPLANLGQAVGGHSYYAYAVLPVFGGVVLCANHWAVVWNQQAVHLGNYARPGDFAIPFAFFHGNGSAYIEGRAVSWEPLPPPPQPTSCRDSALALAQPVVDAAKATWDKHPKNFYLEREWRGAKAVADALKDVP